MRLLLMFAAAITSYRGFQTMRAQKDSTAKTTAMWVVIKIWRDEQIRPVLFIQPGQRRLDAGTHPFKRPR
jgi:hypothetical protein